MPRVLLVDDDAAGLEMRGLIFERRGWAVVTATNPADAREAFSESLDLVVLDVRLPRVEDGLALLRDFRAASRKLRIVVLCGYRGDLEGREEASLADAIFAKPARIELLLNACLPPPRPPSSPSEPSE